MDDKGICIMMVTPEMDEAVVQAIVSGKSSPLMSSFKLSYYTLLNLMRRTEGTTEVGPIAACGEAASTSWMSSQIHMRAKSSVYAGV